ncbi:hypothetical protein ACFQL4_02125 [Halosimplex aquaticum]
MNAVNGDSSPDRDENEDDGDRDPFDSFEGYRNREETRSIRSKWIRRGTRPVRGPTATRSNTGGPATTPALGTETASAAAAAVTALVTRPERTQATRSETSR